MFVSGFTFVRNAIKFDYPIKEAILSIEPLCDEIIVAVGDSEDDTLSLIRSIESDKIKIIETVWDDSLRKGGQVLAIETEKAFHAISEKADWALYIQADEVIHEKFHTSVLQSMKLHLHDKKVEGLLFNYLHFYGSYDYLGDSRKWYSKEVRIIRNDKSIRSFRDAQGFQKHGRPLRVKHSGGDVFHYGWVKSPEKQQAKQETFNKLWHDDSWMDKNIPKQTEFDYSNIDSLEKFTGTHPVVMHKRIADKNWNFDHDISKKRFSFKVRLLRFLDKKFGIKIGEYRNYKII